MGKLTGSLTVPSQKPIMGKLTGSLTEPSERGRSLSNSDDAPIHKNENGGSAAASNVSAEPSPTSPPDTPKSENKSNARISFNSNRRSFPNRRSKNNPAFSNSMIKAVNNAAETARLVLDQAALHDITADDNKSVSSHGSRRSVESASSVHSFNSRRTRSSSVTSGTNGFGMGEDHNCQIPLSGSGDEAEMEEDDIIIDHDTAQIEEATSGDNSFMRSETSCDIGAPFSPPPTAFQNLPMTRGFTPSHKSGDDDDDDLLADGKVFEVTSHYNAAAAISAALASSHLAQASGSVGELQMPIKHPYRAIKKRSSCDFGDASSGSVAAAAQLRRANSGDAVSNFVKEMEELASEEDENARRRSTSFLTPEEAKAEMLSARTSFVSVDSDDEELQELKAAILMSEEKQLSSEVPTNDGHGRNQDSPPRRRSSREEAEAEMLKMRTSFNSLDDNSIGSHQDQMMAALVKLNGGVKKSMHENQLENGTDQKEQGKINLKSQDFSLKSSQDFSLESQNINKQAAERNDVPMKSDDSTSHCSSSGFENESNTSSVYGSNTKSGYSSDISPISSVTGGSRGLTKPSDSGDSNTKGVLGNLANSRRTTITSSLQNSNHSYDGADDEYSTQSENSGLRDEKDQHLPQRRQEIKDGKSKTVTISTKLVSVARPMSTRNLVGPSKKSHGGVLGGDESVKDNYIAPLSPEGKLSNLVKPSAAAPSRYAAPAHRVSLFDSFDRNWQQAVQRSPDPEAMLDLGRKCFSSFAIVFGSCKGSNGCPMFGDTATSSGDAEEKVPSFRWWVDENALTTVGNIMPGPRTTKEGGVSEQEEDLQGIPIVVVRALWKACFFDTEQNAGSDDDINSILDVIQHTLVKELCYLTATATSSAQCLRLSLDVYAEYGWYILRRFAMQDQIPSWHSKFAAVLRQILLDCSLTDVDSMIKRRYAAHSLPRHVAIAQLGVDSNGHFQMDASDDKLTELRTQIFENLLCDRDFIKSRAGLLGRGNTRPGDVDETLNSDEANPQIAKFIRQTRDNDWNLLYSSMAHMKDIEWCAAFCVPELKEGNEHREKDEGMVSPFSDCLDAMVQLKEELIGSFHTLYDNGKLAIGDDTVEESKVESHSEDKGPTKANPLTQLVSYYNEANQNQPGESFIEAAKSLLATDDAWTMKDDSTKMFRSAAKEFSPRPSRKGRRKRIEKEGTAATTSLARILDIDINDLRTAISLGRSLLALAEFSQHMVDKEIFEEGLKGSSSITSRLHLLQSSCLKKAIQVLSCSAITLGYILSSSLDKLDEEDLDETVCTTSSGPDALLQQFSVTREASKPLLSVAGILSAGAWCSLGKLVSKAGKKLTANDHVMLFSFERALIILNSPKSSSLNKPALDLLCESLLSPLTQYKCFLQSNINHSVGVYLYEQGGFERAADYLDKASRFRRQMLDDLRGQAGEISDKCNGLSQLFNAVVGGNYLVSVAAMSEEVFINVFKHSLGYSCVQLPRELFSVSELELSLSLTLEYSALTQHAGQKYQQALSYFQESLILRTMHVGKHSLDVGSLHFNMGVVYDDLEQYDQAISRYHESLRIRLDHLNQAASPAIVAELEDSVMLTLKCMGHVYKIINDMDNAICCYVKALEMLNKKFSAHREHADEWTKMGLRLGLEVPVPTVMFEEMKANTGNTSWKPHFQMMNKKELCHVFNPKLAKHRSRSTVSRLKKELAKIHTTVLELIHERKQKSWDSESGSSRNKLPGSSFLLASLSSSFKTAGDPFEAAMMRSSFFLGRMRLEQMRYEEAADHLETALRSKWVLDPASSSDSDSSASFSSSRKSLSSRKQQEKSIDEDDPEEGQIYYAIGTCNAALDDHERAVRCFLTSMRYLRRSMRKVDSLEVARVLFDCATSHYYQCNFDQAISLYGECLRILKSYERPHGDNGGKTDSSQDDASKITSFRRGVVLYCLVMAKAAIDFDSESSNLLNEAQNLLSGCEDKIILAYMEFLTGLFLHHAACQVPVRLRSITRITPTGLSLVDGLSWNEMCQSTLNLLEQVKNECWFDPLEGVEDSDEVKHLPLSGHICFKKGQVYELINSVDQALNSYVDAANFYRIACGDENMYVASVLHRYVLLSMFEFYLQGAFRASHCTIASVLHRMGMICAERAEYHSLGYFNEALSLRKNLLGGNDRLVADTLYSSAVVLARLNRYEASMERYHEALRIQMADSQDSNEVARTLAAMGNCHYKHRAYDLASTCLEGALKIRKYRVSQLTDSSELVELYGEEVALGADFFNLGNVHMQMGDYAQAMQCFIQSRDLRWRHVGSGTVDKILDNWVSETTVDEDELLGLAHCLHNIGVMFDIKKEYNRSLPHYEEALAIKNAIAGFSAQDSMSLVNQGHPEDNQTLVLQSLNKDVEFPRINKATLSAAVTRQKIATVYAKSPYVFSQYLNRCFILLSSLNWCIFFVDIAERHVLGPDNFRIGNILSSMGNALRQSSSNSETAIVCYNESLRISKLRFGQNHSAVASVLFDIGSLYDSKEKFGKAMEYYQHAVSVYKEKYSQELRRRLCSGLDPPRSLMNGGVGATQILSTGDEIVVGGESSAPEKQIREQYLLVTKALRNAKRRDLINRGESISCIGVSNDAWLTFEVLFFRFVEMLSTYIVDPAQTVVRNTIDGSRQRIEYAAAHAVISAADALDYQFLLMLQE
ncbi:hypothetical protein ACHAXR_013162 [Thalassiosira sp. AJA248-18]